MNVVVVNDYAAINGGAAKIAVDSAIGLAKQGLHVVYFAATGPVEPMLVNNGIEVICLDQFDILNDPKRLRAIMRGTWNMLAAKRMEDLLRRYSPDDTIIHVHGWTKALSSSPVRTAVKSGYKVVFTLHDYFTACPNGGFFDYPAKKICTRNALSVSCVMRNCDVRSYPQKIWRVARQYVQKYVSKIPSGISGFIAVSNFSLEILRDYLPLTSTISLIPNPIETSWAEPVDVASNQDFVYVGRLSKEKGADLFAEAMKQIGLKGVVVGDGPMAAILKGQYPDISYTGWLSPNDVRKILRKARALVFPSLLYETQGLSVMEAISLGIPVIVSDTAAAREAVNDGVTGLLFKGGDIADLEEKIRRLCDNGELAAKIGGAAYDSFWKAPYTIQQHINDVQRFYAQILAN